LTGRPIRRLLWIEKTLHAESAADVGRDDMHAFGGNMEDELGEPVAQRVGALGGTPDGKAFRAVIIVGQDSARFHGIDHDPVVDQG
jgi:hypothetical protein